MSSAAVLGSMRKPERCKQTGLAIPECSCRACCEALVFDLQPRHSTEPQQSLPPLIEPIEVEQAFHSRPESDGLRTNALPTTTQWFVNA
jgi:hypothetical protein